MAVAWGYEARAKGCIGAHLVLSDWEYIGMRDWAGDPINVWDKNSWRLNGAKLVIVDGETIKADTYYRCISGEIVMVNDDGEPVED